VSHLITSKTDINMNEKNNWINEKLSLTDWLQNTAELIQTEKLHNRILPRPVHKDSNEMVPKFHQE
jgi:hypothetical protein